MQTEAKEWPPVLAQLLGEEAATYRELRGSSLTLRKAIVASNLAAVRTEVEAHQALLSQLRAQQQAALRVCREGGLLAPEEPYRLSRLRQAVPDRDHAPVGVALENAVAAARDAARELAHNRQLIARLSAWASREIRLLLEPLTNATRYGAAQDGETRSPGAALVDRRG